MRNTRVRRRRARAGNRTRTLFFVFIAVILGVIAFSLSAQIINKAALLQIYIAASILAVGVVVIDMMGLLGSQHDDGSEDGGDDDGGHDGFGHDDGSFGGHEGDFTGADDSIADGGDDGGLDVDSADDGDSADEAPLHDVDHDSAAGARGPVLEAIRYLRMFVYFCLGFGLIGLAILATDRTAQASLVFASVAGFGTVLLARTFYRFQPRDTGEVMPASELLREQGTVTVPLNHEIMGKVRVQAGMDVQEVYALAAEEGKEYARGDTVRVVKVSDECVYVDDL